MKEFALIFRNDNVGEIKLTAEGTLAISKDWQDWIGGIAQQGKLASTGARPGSEGKIVQPGNVITNGPYAEIKEIIAGLIIIKADSIDEATEIAKGCPILNIGGNVEVRDVMVMNN